MKRSIHLYIGTMEAEFATIPDVLYTFKVDDITSPAAVKNSYSKTITLPGTPQNNKIFGEYWAGDRLTANGYDASRKTPFTLYVDNEVYQTGYCRLTQINQSRNSVSYDVSLFGGLGEFFANLEYSNNEAGTDEKRKLSDLEFYSGEESVTPLELGFTINKETVKAAWDNIDSYSSKWRVLNFAPAYNGLPSDFDADKVLMNVGSVTATGNTSGPVVRRPGGRGSVVVTSVTEDGQTYTTYGGYALAELPRDYTESEMREFRSYLQRPVLNVQRTIEAICRPENNGGWTVTVDPEWAKYDNKYWADMWVTLPMLSTLDYTTSQANSGVSVSLGNSATGNTTVSGEQQYHKDVLASLSSTDSGFSYNVNVKLSLDILGSWDIGGPDKLVICAYYPSGGFTYASGIMVQLVAYDAMGNPVAGSDEYYITSAYGARRVSDGGGRNQVYAYFVPRDTWKYRPPYGDGFVSATSPGYFEQIWGNRYRWDQEISLTAKNIPAGSTLKVLVTKVCGESASPSGVKNVFYRYEQGGQQTQYTTYTFSDFEVTLNSSTVSFNTNEGIRTGAAFTKNQLLNTDYSIADFLISYAKIFGLYFLADPIKKHVDILTRKNFFKRDEIVNIEDKIDRGSVRITPLVFDSKWYDWNLDADESEYGKAYEDTYGKKYGQAKINTDFNFNRDTKEVLEGNIFKNAVQVLERSTAYCYTGQDDTSKSWMFPGYTYLLYNTTDATDSHEVEVPASSTIDAFSAFTQGYMYYDLFDKVQLHTADNSPADGKNVLLIRTGNKELAVGSTSLNYFITDDNSYHNILNQGKPCWLYTNSERDANNNSIATRITYAPYFSRYEITEGSGYILKSMDFGFPEEIYIPRAVYRQGSTIYEQFWKAYISDLYNKNTRVLKTKMYIKEKPSNEWLRRFYYLDSSIWRMTAINDYNVAKDALTEVEFVKVNDVANYTSEIPTEAIRIDISLSSYQLPSSGGTVQYTITVSDGGPWAFEDWPYDTTLSATAGTGDYTGTWTIPANGSSDYRQLRLVVMADNASATATLTLKSDALSINGPYESGMVPWTGGTRTYRVISPDSPWSATTDYTGIISSISPSAGTATNESGVTVTVTVERNDFPSTRQAYINARTAGGRVVRSSAFIQEPAVSASISVTPSYIGNAPYSGNSYTVLVTSTEEWYGLTSYPDWLEFYPSSGSSGTTEVTVNMFANGGPSRFGQVYFYRQSVASEPAVLTISQTANPDISISVSPASVGQYTCSGGTVTLEVTSTNSWRAYIYDTRLMVSPTQGGSGTTTVTATIAENTGDTRNLYVKFYIGNSPNEIYANFLVTQLSPDAPTYPTGYTNDMEYTYLTVQRVSDTGTGNVTIKRSDTTTTNTTTEQPFEYSLDNGETWVQSTSGITLDNVDDKVLIRSYTTTTLPKSNIPGYGGNQNGYLRLWLGTSRFAVYGNMLSLIFGSGFTTSIVENTEYIDFGGFCANQSALVSAGGLVIPHIGGTRIGASSMFYKCGNLAYPPEYIFDGAQVDASNMFYSANTITYSPIVEITDYTGSDFSSMFERCPNISTLTFLCQNATGVSTYGQVMYKGILRGSFVSGVFRKHPNASVGTFTDSPGPTSDKPVPNTTWVKSPASGEHAQIFIPDGWTVEDYTSE